MFAANRRNRAFSLIELVIVVVIIGIIGAIAIPRMSRGAQGAADSALIADLTRMRAAIDLFQAEHGGTYPSGTSANVTSQLTGYSDDSGAAQAGKDSTHIYGPYLRTIPALPVGAMKGNNTFNVITVGATGFAYAAGSGWWYNSVTGQIQANCQASEADTRGTLYSTY